MFRLRRKARRFFFWPTAKQTETFFFDYVRRIMTSTAFFGRDEKTCCTGKKWWASRTMPSARDEKKGISGKNVHQRNNISPPISSPDACCCKQIDRRGKFKHREPG